MKIAVKTTLIMVVFGLFIVIALSIGYYFYSYRITEEKETINLTKLADEVSVHVESHIKERIFIAKTLASAPILKEYLIDSNKYFSNLENRDEVINQLNKRWTEAKDNDPFVLSYLENRPSHFLKLQSEIIPKEYGEIFLTNRYGVLLSSSNRLTTLKHSHKYWWIESYNKGSGKIFIDDRGYDKSVKGYVLGVTVPVISEGEVIGVLKSNINIEGPLTDIIFNFNYRNSSRINIARSKGMILSGEGIKSGEDFLSTDIVNYLKSGEKGVKKILHMDKEVILAYTPINISKGSSEIGFGGRPNSIDHSYGSNGDLWYILLYLDKSVIRSPSKEILSVIIWIGSIAILISLVPGILLGRMEVRPILKLAETAKYLDEDIEDISDDEISIIANTLNIMTKRLKSVIEAKNQLLREMERQKKFESKLKKISNIDELTGIYNRRGYNHHLKINISRARRHGESLCLLLIDIDKYKDINDIYGHSIGDMVLKKLTKIFKASCREEDIVARWGGDEFIILLPHTEGETAVHLAERIRKQTSEYDFTDIESMTVSIGVTQFIDTDSVATFIKRADSALYMAKEGGRNSVKLY